MRSDYLILELDSIDEVPKRGKYLVFLKDGDEHAIIFFEDGIISRDDYTQPCVQHTSGRVEWRKDGVLHRDPSPAVMHVLGASEFWKNGKRHCIKHAAIYHMTPNAYKMWVREFEHCVLIPEGSSIEKIEEIYGPGYFLDGGEDYWVHGIHLTKQQWLKYLEKTRGGKEELIISSTEGL